MENSREIYQNKKSKNIDIIDVIKSFAIISVIYLHCFFSARADKILFAPFTIYLAVPIFMIISGFTYSISFSKYDSEKSVLKTYFGFKNLYSKLIRILPCYFIVFAVELLVNQYKFDNVSSIFRFVYYLGTGGYYYQGSYYIPVLIQLIIVFPVLKLMYNKLKTKSFIVVAVFCLLYEFFVYYFNVHYDIQRLIIVRYFIFILGGIFIFDKYKDKNVQHKALYIISLILGLVWITAINYFDFAPKYFFTQFLTTSFPCALFLVPLILFLIQKIGHVSFPFVFKILGKASYHIYLMQMLYFGIVRKHIDFINIEKSSINFIAGVLFSSVTGIFMYYAENRIIHFIRKKKSLSQS